MGSGGEFAAARAKEEGKRLADGGWQGDKKRSGQMDGADTAVGHDERVWHGEGGWARGIEARVELGQG
ncbi:hypothetical protein NL676_019125 [Syzygium grande]|nr:hypothetical protein NL676_019125 [Syzygium grande]